MALRAGQVTLVKASKQIAEDGESNWLEGVQLIVVCLLAALGFLLL
ncbi:MAG: hypothetical protein M3R52_02735 [Acidobacteriota bacterium]|nr:hypothetical protein [Acidobacteriota bacterium]